MSDVLESAASDLRAINTQFKEAEYLIAAMKEAGEDVTEQEKTLRELRIKREKWVRMLQSRGISVKE